MGQTGTGAPLRYRGGYAIIAVASRDSEDTAMEIIPDKRKLVGLVEQAYDGKLCLPDFQRDFVWPREQVADLVRSVVRRYFVGSLLLLRCDPQRPPFAPIALKGAKPRTATPLPELLVLDGQQRLTALLYALTAPDSSLKDSTQRRWFFLDLNLLISDPDNDEIVFDRTTRELDGLDREEVQYQRNILPCTRLMRSSDFLQWRDGLDDWLRENDSEKYKRFRAELRDKWTKAITEFQTFDVPLVELPRVDDSNTDSIGRVCAIFEKLNSTGIELSVYDLLTARLYRSGIKLHDLWNEACGKNKRLNEWSEGKADAKKFGVMVLRVLAMLRDIDPKPKNIINLVATGFAEDWRQAAAAMERALELVTHVGQDGFGVFDPKWLPGHGLLPVLAVLRLEIEKRKLGERPRNDLRRWYWCSVFLERYSSAVESKSRRDHVEMLAYWQDGKQEPSVFVEARARIAADGFSIGHSASPASSIYSGVFCLLALAGARDWRRGEDIQLQSLQDHHIFPRAYLRRHGFTKAAEVNTIVNRTLISDETNNKIKAKAPADYVSCQEIFPSGPNDSLLAPHFLSPAAVDVMRKGSDDGSADIIAAHYSAFRKAREVAIISRIREVCGLQLSNSVNQNNVEPLSQQQPSISPGAVNGGSDDDGVEPTDPGGSRESRQKDLSQYKFEGKLFGKGRLVHAVLSEFLRRHPETSIDALKRTFPETLQGSLDVVVLADEAKTQAERSGRARHFIRDAELLIAAGNVRVAVCSQWGAGNIDAFLVRARELGFVVEKAPSA
jgi:hypothetical protein